MSKLADLGQILNGAPVPKNKGKYPAFGGNGIISYVDKYNYKSNTVVIGRVGANCGDVSFSDKECWVTDNALALIVNEQNDPYFVYNLLKVLKLNTFHIGSSQPLITQRIINNIECNYIKDINHQKRIGSFFSNIDKKIQNNKKQIETLESIAKTIYDYWFVQFDFPNEDGKPYKSSGGKMVWNEELKREIPEGWIVRTLNDLLLVSKDRIASNEIEDRVYVPIEAIPRNKMSFSETSDIDKAATGLCSFEEKAILFSNRRVYFHKVSISPFKGVTRDTVIIMYPKNKSNLGYAFQIVNSDHYIEYATKNSYGTEQPVLATPTALSYKYACPITGLEIIYSKKVAKIIDKVLEMEREIKVLTTLRNFLIPLLVNGQVTLQ